MKHAEAIAQVAKRSALSGLRMLTATVSVAPASHLVGINLGDGTTLTVTYSAALSLAAGDVVLVLADGRRMFVAFKIA